jgi:hypothetical protein
VVVCLTLLKKVGVGEGDVMLEVQRKLKSGVETPESLLERFGIVSKEEDGIRLFDYDQILSTKVKDHRIVRECRGLALTENYDIVAVSFLRFFNIFENNDTEIFDWSDFSTTTKLDGSLIRVVYYNNEFRVFTRYSFGNQILNEVVGKTWKELVLNCLSETQKLVIKTYPNYTYVFEFTSPYNQVVVYHPVPKLILLAIFNNNTGEEVSKTQPVYKWSRETFEWVPEHKFNSLKEIEAELDRMFYDKSTEEGFVIKDKNGVMLKCKSKFYITLHRLSNNGNIASWKSILPIILIGEEEEIIAYFPHIKPVCDLLKIAIEDDLLELQELYGKVIVYQDQKDFAIALTKDNYTPYSSLFFQLKKEFGNAFTFEQLKQSYLASTDLVLKVFKNKGIWEGEE